MVLNRLRILLVELQFDHSNLVELLQLLDHLRGALVRHEVHDESRLVRVQRRDTVEVQVQLIAEIVVDHQ